LRNCYQNSLSLAEKHNLKTIAFPAISTGAYYYPLKQAAFIAINTCLDFTKDKDVFEKIIFVCFTPTINNIYIKYLNELKI
jgi:O-acetyl-ADP-ribose deacetylase (regulator of RNase III)